MKGLKGSTNPRRDPSLILRPSFGGRYRYTELRCSLHSATLRCASGATFRMMTEQVVLMLPPAQRSAILLSLWAQQLENRRHAAIEPAHSTTSTTSRRASSSSFGYIIRQGRQIDQKHDACTPDLLLCELTLIPSFPCYNIELWNLSYRQSRQRGLAGTPNRLVQQSGPLSALRPETSPISSSTTINEALAGTTPAQQCLPAAYTCVRAATMASSGTWYCTITSMTSRRAWANGTQESSRPSI